MFKILLFLYIPTYLFFFYYNYYLSFSLYNNYYRRKIKENQKNMTYSMIKFLNQKWSHLLITHCCPPTTESSALYLEHWTLYLVHWPLCFERRLLRFVQSSSRFVQSCIERRTSTTGFSAAGSGQSTLRVAQGAKFVVWRTKNGTRDAHLRGVVGL